MNPSQKMIESGVPDEPNPQAEPVEVGEPEVEPAPEPALGDNQETSMVTSVVLHLISEHGVVAALHMSEDEGHEKHGHCHAEYVEPHDPQDIRFRPGRIMSRLAEAAKQDEAFADLPIPQPRRT